MKQEHIIAAGVVVLIIGLTAMARRIPEETFDVVVGVTIAGAGGLLTLLALIWKGLEKLGWISSDNKIFDGLFTIIASSAGIIVGLSMFLFLLSGHACGTGGRYSEDIHGDQYEVHGDGY